MPPRGSSQKPPEAMTLGKALPVLVFAAIIDLASAFFEMFWFFGPALAAIYCTNEATGLLTKYTLGVLGAKTAGITCSAAAIAGGVAASETIAVFGVIMAIAVGLLGFLVLGLWILTTNARIFKANASGALWFVGGFGLKEIPLVGVVPAFSFVLWKLYLTQIRVEKAALQKWEKQHTQEIADQRSAQQQQAAHLMQMRNTELAEDAIY